MNYRTFFLENNKSGWKTREEILKNKEPDIFNTLKLFIKDNNLTELPFKQQVWHFINNEPKKKYCTGCGNEVTFKDRLSKGYNEFCSLICANTNGSLKDRVSTSIKDKFGVNYFTQHDTFIAKVKKTKLERYGDENYNNIGQCLKTKEQLYGDKNYSNKKQGNITIRENLLSKLSSLTSDKLIKYNIGDTNILLTCSSCNNDYEIYQNLFNYRTSVNVKPCTICNPIKETNSIQEKELLNYLESLISKDSILSKDRTLISNIKSLELDIYIPSHNLAIEFDGLYWHSEEYVKNNYHLNKTLECRKLGVDLIHIFEDEWMYKRNIVKSMIRSKLGLNNLKLFGRKCKIKEVSPHESKIFLNLNHIQGNVNAGIKLGLYYDDELVSLMTFGGLRKSMGLNSKEGIYEMYRFANKLNTSVIGGFSKLLNYFIKVYQPREILTFSDNRYFTGNIYKNNGFEFIYETGPNYYYINKHKREYRFKYRKDVLVRDGYDKNKTERQIMLERGISRIYDCGNKKWLLKLIQ